MTLLDYFIKEFSLKFSTLIIHLGTANFVATQHKGFDQIFFTQKAFCGFL